MADPYNNEWSKINEIAKDVQGIIAKINQLEIQSSNIQAHISQLSYEIDEDGNDVNEQERNILYIQLEEVRSEIERGNEARQRLRLNAYELSSAYSRQANVYEEEAKKDACAKTQFGVVSRHRFGSGTVRAGERLTGQREVHYKDHVSILNSLAAAARSAADGIIISRTAQQISERGTFGDPHRQAPGTKKGEVGRDASENTNFENNIWSGVPGNSVKRTKDKVASSILTNLGIDGIPYKNGIPDFSGVSHAKVAIGRAGVGIVAEADAALAKTYGVRGADIAAYRKENGLEWRGDGNNEYADLIPQSISQAYADGRQQQEPTAVEELTAYMGVHNYGKEDYDTYSKESEWIKLHQAAFQEQHDLQKADPNSIVVIDGQHYRTDDTGKIHMKRDSDGQYYVLPNITYTVNGYMYQTDEHGRVVHAEGKLKLKDGKRNPLNSQVPDKKPGDHRGHIIADRFDASNMNDNLIAMRGDVNQNAYKLLEDQLASLCKEHSVYYENDILYDQNTKRPSWIIVNYSIDNGSLVSQKDLVEKLGIKNQEGYDVLEKKLSSLYEQGSSVKCWYSVTFSNNSQDFYVTVNYSIDGEDPISRDIFSKDEV